MTGANEGDSQSRMQRASQSVGRRFVRAAVAERLFGVAIPARLGEFELLRRAGEGGTGLVFEARDTRTDHHVALKVLRWRGAAAMQRMKREFRTLAGLHHPHLVQLYQLYVDGEHPFVTMELVRGMRLLEYVAPESVQHVERVRRVMVQLVDAVSALHRAGFVHRDLKPSNVLVDGKERLVVIDFGSACPIGAVTRKAGSFSGTPLYVAPERRQLDRGIAASDWYCVGLILAEVLGVKLQASLNGILDRAALYAQLSALPAAIPVELVRLARDLLHEDPEARPNAAAMQALFDVKEPARTKSLRYVTDPLFVGRASELCQLQRALRSAQEGAFAIAHICGAPGIGKSALAAHFLRALSGAADVVVMTSRCYEREFIAYNAIDGVVDALAKGLETLPAARRHELIQPGTYELLRLFPTLRRALPLQPGDADPVAARDVQRAQQRAFGALRSLLSEFAAGRTLVLHLDDLQWSDADSAQLLRELFRPPLAMRLLLIASYRIEGEQNASVQELRKAQPADPAQVVNIALGGLGPGDVRQLAGALCAHELSDAQLAGLAHEAEGSPLFLRLLVQHRIQSSGTSDSSLRLQPLFLSMVDELPEPMRRLLQLTALAGQPLDPELLLRAGVHATLTVSAADQLATLQNLSLLRRVQHNESVRIDTYHDRLREIVYGAVSDAERRNCHTWLAQAALETDSADSGFLATQCEGAGWLDRAAGYAEAAGDSAFESIALQRAVRCYEQALRCLSGARPPELLRKLAEASACMGRTSDVAALYVELASKADASTASRFRLRAAEVLMRSGSVEASIDVIKPLLRNVGLPYPRTTQTVRQATAAALSRIAQRVFDTPAMRREATKDERLRIDMCFNLGYRVILVDPVPGGLLLALKQANAWAVEFAF